MPIYVLSALAINPETNELASIPFPGVAPLREVIQEWWSEFAE
jgi:hypothetical protein